VSYALNAITAPDNYGPGSTIEGVPIKRINLDVANQAIYWQLKSSTAGVGGVWDATEVFMLPGSRTLLRRAVGIRIRAAIPAASLPAGAMQAVATVEAVT
jgi:hypothetical protein